ncbi:hypothetical protein [uncultured Gammaproteobacteria bacterium]|uniref:NfeD family protein n=1 Tax=Bathymodiolus heckerae thiotrophic gill symbiont TaxID=1052212 RepID=UPI0010B1E506|nr:NfeD family protein [Bathymodiolus heckerae thiotrophic gill symbiont]CAC9602606.1 hypothetical protein [uncultured Gammaproteobacteria bacterium]CAC9605240.1 hypothetical protein [uncultured Gammaproteobacteria bacterium]CAC9951799.1 hypothetical protein [uncultured Gammaproteobacteria bacterium]SHN90836.1 hypothetical protein BHECKSOX_992 [Bathymodiolus heckerae thiotrophic gill symbiont]
MEFITDFWQWWILAVILVIVELFVPTFFALLVAIAAFVTGIALFLIPNMQWEYQVLIFAILSVVIVVVWRYFHDKNPTETDEPLLNRRGEQYVGRVITLKTPIEDGQGKVQVDDSTWKVEGEDCPIGTKVKLISVDNVIFKVEIVH